MSDTNLNHTEKPKVDEPPDKKKLFKQLEYVEDLVKGNLDFVVKLYQTCRAETLQPNIVICPVMVAASLSMTMAGAKENSVKQLKDVLHLNAMEDGLAIHLAWEDLLHSMTAKTMYPKKKDIHTVKLRLANRMYLHEDYRAQPEFLAMLRQYYNVTVPSVDFIQDVEPIRLQVNHWMEEQTDQKVKDLIGPGSLDHLTRLLLVNGGYFKGKWIRKFYHDPSHPGKFFTDKDNSISMDLIQNQGQYMYAESKSLKCSAVEIPYAGNRFGLLILLPKDVAGLNVLETKMTGEDLDGLIDSLSPATVNVMIPKSKIEGHFALADNIIKMGATDPFSRKKSDLSGLAVPAHENETNLFVSSIHHKACVEISDEGGDVATEVPLAASSSCFCRSRTVRQFVTDRPFLFLIREIMTGMVLFIGSVKHPIPLAK